MTSEKALKWTILWVFNALCFGIGIYLYSGIEKASMFMNVYLVEKLLSFDNLFIFLLIFNYFKVPSEERRDVLNYGIVGALILRLICITSGIELIEHLKWVLYCLGGLLIYSAWGVAFKGDDENDMEESRIIRFAKSFNLPHLFIWIIAIELSDIMFAIDSIPVGLSISQDIFIVYSANIFAILGLRSLYFFIESIYVLLPQLKYGIALILLFIGIKMFLPLIKLYISPGMSLGIIIAILIGNIIYIAIRLKKK